MNSFTQSGGSGMSGMPALYTDPSDEIENGQWLDWTVFTVIAIVVLVSVVVTHRPLRKGECYWHRKFLESLENQGTVSGAAREAGMTIEHCHKHRDKNPYFRKQWDKAADRFIANLTGNFDRYLQ